MAKMIVLWINKFLANDSKHKLRAFRTAYTFDDQDYGVAMLFVIIKMVRPDTRSVFSDIKSKLETMKMSLFKTNIPISNLHIS